MKAIQKQVVNRIPVEPADDGRLSEKHHFIAWIKFQRRAVSMQPFFGFDLCFVPAKFDSKKLKIFDYVYKAAKTTAYLLRHRPQIVWVQMPPTPLLTMALLYKKINKKAIVIADCHNSMFSEKWKRHLDGAKDLNKVDIIITHNHVIKERAIERGVDRAKVRVLETKPAAGAPKATSGFDLGIKNSWILMPCAFAEDEPMSVVFEAARMIPDVTFVLTGNTKRAAGIHDLSNIPSNVVLTKYLSKEDYESLLAKTDAVLGLTTEHHVQLSVANEATGFEKPMVLSDTPLLRELFSRGAVYVETLNPISLANGIQEAIRTKEFLTGETKKLKEERNSKWQNQALQIKNQIFKLIRNQN